MARPRGSILELIACRRDGVCQPAVLARAHLRLEDFRERHLICSPGLQKLWSIRKLHHGNSIAILNGGNESQGNRARNICIFQTELIAGIEQQENVDRQALNAANLLRHAVLKHEHVIYYQGWIIVSILIESDDGQAHFFSKYANRLLLFGFGRELRGRRWLCGRVLRASGSGRNENQSERKDSW